MLLSWVFVCFVDFLTKGYNNFSRFHRFQFSVNENSKKQDT